MTIIWNETPKRGWKPEQSAECLRLKQTGLSLPKIAKALGRTPGAVQNHLQWLRISPAKRQQYNAKRKRQVSRPPSGLGMENAVSFRPTAEMLADRARREVMPHRDLTAVLMGDPPLGLSALDGRQY